MTCRHALSLLEDFVDGELPDHDAEELRQHLATCSSCREEHDRSRQLRESLQSHITPEPPPGYWGETERLILARTIDGRDAVADTGSSDRETTRRAFVRSVLSVAVSLAVLVSAVIIGSNRQGPVVEVSAQGGSMLVTAPLVGLTGSDDTVIMTRAEHTRLAVGVLLMGTPGLAGRFVAFPDLMTLE